MSTQSAGGTAIRFDQAPAAAREAAAEQVGASSLIRGALIALALTAIAALVGILLTLAVFGYSLGELL